MCAAAEAAKQKVEEREKCNLPWALIAIIKMKISTTIMHSVILYQAAWTLHLTIYMTVSITTSS